MKINEQNNKKIARVEVEESQLSLAIGKKGQNSRLAARLCGIKIDIHAIGRGDETERESAEEDIEGEE